MYGLPPNVDLGFLKGKRLIQICVGANDLILRFDEDGVSIVITSLIGIHVRSNIYKRYSDFRESASSVVKFLDDSVTGVHGEPDGTLTVEFRGGGKFRVYDDSEHFESYVIHNKEKVIVV